MINIKSNKSLWKKTSLVKEDIDQRDYMKHFQLAIINLEQNLIEERIPILQMSA